MPYVFFNLIFIICDDKVSWLKINFLIKKKNKKNKKNDLESPIVRRHEVENKKDMPK